MSYISTLTNLFLSLTQTNYLTFNELCIIYKQSGLNDMMINNVVEDIVRTTSGISTTDKFNCDQFIYGMLLIYRNFQMDVETDLSILRKKLKDSTLADLESLQKQSMKVNSPTVHQKPVSKVEFSASDIYTSSHRRKPISKTSGTTMKEQLLRQLGLLRDIDKYITSNHRNQISADESPFRKHTQDVSLIIEYILIKLHSDTIKTSKKLKSLEVLNKEILILERKLFMVRDAKKHNYNIASAESKIESPSSNPNSIEEKAQKLLSERMKTLGLKQDFNPNESKLLGDGVNRANSYMKPIEEALRTDESINRKLLKRMQNIDGTFEKISENAWSEWWNIYLNFEVEPSQSKIREHINTILRKLFLWDSTNLERCRQELKNIGLPNSWIESPVLKYKNPDDMSYQKKVQNLNIFKELDLRKPVPGDVPTEIRNSPPPIPPTRKSNRNDKSAEEDPTESITRTNLTRLPFLQEISSTKTRLIEKDAFGKKEETQLADLKSKNNFNSPALKNALEHKEAFNSSPTPASSSSFLNARTEVTDDKRGDLLSAIRGSGGLKGLKSSTTNSNILPTTLISDGRIGHNSNLVDQMKQGISERRLAFGQSSESDDSWSESSNSHHITPNQIDLKSDLHNIEENAEVLEIFEPSKVDSINNVITNSTNEIFNDLSPHSELTHSFEKVEIPVGVFHEYRALYDFRGTEEGDLSFSKGDKIIVNDSTNDLSQNETSWWSGYIENIEGMFGNFPANYVILEDYELIDPPFENNLGKQIHEPRGLQYARCIFDFEAVQTGDLNMKKGDLLIVSDFNPDVGWVNAQFYHDFTKHGDIPVNYIEFVNHITPTQDTEELYENNKVKDVIQEFIMTERTYVRDIQMVVELFVRPLHINKIISIEDVSNLFCNLVVIEDANAEFLSKIEAATDSLSQSMFLNILKAFSEQWNIYTEYCSYQYVSLQTFKRLQNTNPKFCTFIKENMSDPRCRNLDLNSFLLLPMQRITRYNLLLKQILHNTPKESKLLVLTASLAENIDSLVNKINEEAKIQESKVKISDLEKTIDMSQLEYPLKLSEKTKLQGQRILINEGPLEKAKSGRKLYAFLFNDMLLLTEPTTGSSKYTLYRKPLRLSELVNLQRLQDVDNIIRLATYDFEILLRASNPSSFKMWTNCIKKAIESYNMTSKLELESEKLGKFINSQRLTSKAESVFGISQQNTLLHNDELMEKPAVIFLQEKLNKLDRMLRIVDLGEEQLLTQGMTKQFIGTIQVNIGEGENFPPTDLKKFFVLIQVGNQRLKTKIVKNTLKPKFNQVLLFSLKSLDDVLKIFLYNQTKYAEDVMVGFHELPLNFLEYYGEKETENMIINVGSEARLSVKLRFKSVSQ
eukprot:NODE_10_length_61504_cov_0.956502.p1 type:complete len:1364 gc:universal NODE_10_length_61504_cov_0.956502:118-4209(+)